MTLRKLAKKVFTPLLATIIGNRVIRSPFWALNRANMLPQAIWGRLPVEFDFVVTLSAQHSFRYKGSRDDSIGRSLYWKPLASWEYQTIKIYQKLAKTARLVLDIGANTGVYSLIACAVNPTVKVIALEPVYHVYKRLVTNINLNSFQHRCEMRPEAVSDFVGQTLIYIPEGDLTIATLNPNGWGGVKGYPTDINVITVDEICANEEFVDLVKIDVEGWEHRVLLGMQNVLTKHFPILIMECAPEGPLKEVNSILSDLDYLFFSLHRPQPQRIHYLTPNEIKTDHWNVLCVPKIKLLSVEDLFREAALIYPSC